ncbi:uncharacterized protein LOC141579698 [Camelus bactrianus]|uniref:Uncharacterized protein LOC141579698 n=1 Tax=Camelus bactrianus TaxID=9837 RepID=A0AC58RHA1_CAMBA
MPNPILLSLPPQETPVTRLMPRELHDTRWAKQQQAGRKGEFCGSISEERRGRKGKGRAARARADLPLGPAEHKQTAEPQLTRTSLHLQHPPPARPRGGPSGAGAGRGEAQRAAAALAGEGRGRPRSPHGRQRRGSPAGHSAAARRVLLLGRRRRRLLQPSSQRRAAPGVRSTFSRSFPHAAPREGSFAHAHAAPDRTFPRKDKKFGKSPGGGGGKSPTEVRRLGSPLGAAAAGGADRRRRARPTQFIRRSPSARCPRWPDWHPSCRPCGLGREPAAAPPHISGLRAEAEQWPLPHERLKARTGARGSGEVLGQATPRTATEGRCPPTKDPKEFSVSANSLAAPAMDPN